MTGKRWAPAAILIAAIGSFGCAMRGAPPSGDGVATVGTFSIVAVDPKSGEIGIATQSRIVAVGAVVPWAEADVGAVATQAWADPSFGPRGLALLRKGLAPEQAVEQLLAEDPKKDQRQLAVIDAKGNAFAFTGGRCSPWAGSAFGPGCAAVGNILAGRKVVDAMVGSFAKAEGDLGDRLIAALRAGQAAGGDRRGRQSAALLVVRRGAGYGGHNDRYRDLRVDDHPTPIEELGRIYKLHKKMFPAPKPQ